MSSSDTSACVGSYKVVTHDDGIHVTLLMVDFADLATYKEWAGGRTAVSGVLEGLGDEAFVGPKGATEPTILCFRTGDRAVRIAAAPGGTEVGEDDLRTVADLILSRL